jgi:hypothetical protein
MLFSAITSSLLGPQASAPAPNLAPVAPSTQAVVVDVLVDIEEEEEEAEEERIVEVDIEERRGASSNANEENAPMVGGQISHDHHDVDDGQDGDDDDDEGEVRGYGSASSHSALHRSLTGMMAAAVSVLQQNIAAVASLPANDSIGSVDSVELPVGSSDVQNRTQSSILHSTPISADRAASRSSSLRRRSLYPSETEFMFSEEARRAKIQAKLYQMHPQLCDEEMALQGYSRAAVRYVIHVVSCWGRAFFAFFFFYIKKRKFLFVLF